MSRPASHTWFAALWEQGARRAGVTLLLALAAVLVTTGTARSQTFIFAWGSEPVGLDPAVVTDATSLAVTSQLFDTLVRLRGATTEIEPGLAERWETSADGRVWTFHLRPNVRFHDGQPLDAAAVVWNVERWWKSRHPEHDDQVRAGQTFEYWESQFGGFDDRSVVAKVEALGAQVVRIALREPHAPLLADLAIPGFGIASPRAVERWGIEFGKHPVGSGAFRFAAWQAGQGVTLEANPDHWEGAPRVKRVVTRTIRDGAQRLAALKAGEVHGIEGLNPDDIQVVRRDPGLVLVLRPANSTAYLAFNYRVKAFQDRRVRQAFAHAIDKPAIVRALYGGTGLVATQFQPPSLWGHDPDLRDFGFDPARARALLRQAGLPNGLAEITWEDGRREPLALWYMPVTRPYYPSPRETAEAVAVDLARAGIRAQLRTVDWAVYLERAKHGRLPLFMLGWIGDNGDPDNCLCYVFCIPGAPNQGFYGNRTLTDLLRRAQRLTSRTERAPLYREAERLLHDDVGRIFLAHSRTPLVFSKRVRGYVPNPTGTESFAAVEIH